MAAEILVDLTSLVVSPTSFTFEESLNHQNSFSCSDESDLSEDEYSSEKSSRLSGYIPVFLGTPMVLRQKLKKAAKKLKRSSSASEYEVSEKHYSWNSSGDPTSIYQSHTNDYQVQRESRYEDRFRKVGISHAISPSLKDDEQSKPPLVTPFIFHKESKVAPKTVVDERCCFCEESMKYLLDNERPLLLSCSHLVHYECLARLVDTRKLKGKDTTVCFPECPNCGEYAKPTDDFYLQEMINNCLCLDDRVPGTDNASREFKIHGRRGTTQLSRESMSAEYLSPLTTLTTIVESSIPGDLPTPHTPINPPSLSYFESSPESAASGSTLCLSPREERPTNVPMNPNNFATDPMIFSVNKQHFGKFSNQAHNNPSMVFPTMAQLAQMPLSERRRYKTNSGSLNKYHPTSTLSAAFQQKY